MVGLGPTIHEFQRARACYCSKLVDGRAKHDQDEKGVCTLSLTCVHGIIPAAAAVQAVIDQQLLPHPIAANNDEQDRYHRDEPLPH
jgi:hypothetical protein